MSLRRSLVPLSSLLVLLVVAPGCRNRGELTKAPIATAGSLDPDAQLAAMAARGQLTEREGQVTPTPSPLPVEGDRRIYSLEIQDADPMGKRKLAEFLVDPECILKGKFRREEDGVTVYQFMLPIHHLKFTGKVVRDAVR